MIDTEALRKKVIDLAIQGKLTQQLSEDGNADDLFAQIQDEKTNLIKEGKIKKEKPLPEISDDEIPFEIPKNWKWVRINDIGSWSAGSTPSRGNPAYYKDGTIPWIKTGELNDGVIIDAEEYITDKAFLDCSVRLNPAGSVLIAMYGATIGKVAILDIEATTNQACCACIPIGIYNRFLFYYLKYNKDRFIEASHGGAQPNISKEIITKSVMPLPPTDEQRRIVSVIDEASAQIDRIDALQQKFESDQEILKGKIINAGIRGKLTEQLPDDGDAEDLYDQIQTNKSSLIEEGKLRRTRGFKNITEDAEPYNFPKSWKICYIDDVAFVTKLAGFEYTKYIADSICEQGIPLFKGKNIQKGELILEFESFIPMEVSDGLPRSQVNKKCLLTPYVGTIGNIALFDGAFKAHLGSNVGKIEILNPSNVCLMEEFLLIYLRSDIGYSELNKHKKATAQDSISIDAIRNVIIAIPPIEEQRRIVNKISELLMIMEL